MPDIPDSTVPPDAGRWGAPGVDLAAHGPFRDDGQSAGAVLEDLRRTVGFRFWAVTRLTGQTSTIIATGPDGFPAEAGDQVGWADTLCRAVLEGRAPRIAPDAAAVPAFHGLALTRDWQVGAYLSAPLTVDGAALFGTVCAVDPQLQPDAVGTASALVDHQAR